jgi:hypothetical protein
VKKSVFCKNRDKNGRYSASTQKSIISKSVTNVSIIGIMLTPKEAPPLGGLGYKPWPPAGGHRTCARDLAITCGNCFRGAEQPRRLAGARKRGAPESRFFAEQKIRPNEVLKKSLISVNSFQGEALYSASP